MLEELKTAVYEANMQLYEMGLAPCTWGNVSGIDRQSGLIVIKPSGVSYPELMPQLMSVVDMKGNVVEGQLRPSTDTLTHIELYKAFPKIGGVVHTHSKHAVAWAQTGRFIPPYGTTHADFASDPIPCTRELSRAQVEEAYELNTGKVIAECFSESGMDYEAVPAVLVRFHGPFCWGKSAADAVVNAEMLERIAEMAMNTEMLAINPRIRQVNQYVLEKHFSRKHGKKAYYGQRMQAQEKTE